MGYLYNYKRARGKARNQKKFLLLQIYQEKYSLFPSLTFSFLSLVRKYSPKEVNP